MSKRFATFWGKRKKGSKREETGKRCSDVQGVNKGNKSLQIEDALYF